MKFEEIENLIETTLKKHFQDVERRDYREIEANDPVRFKGYSDRSGLMYLVEYNDNYIDANICKESIRLQYRDMYDELISVTFRFEDFTPQHLAMFIDLIDEHQTMFSKWEDKVQKLERSQLPNEYIRMGKLDEITKV